MSTKGTIRNSGIRTGLIILGIILAAILTWHSSSFVFSSIPFFSNSWLTQLHDLTSNLAKPDFVQIGEILDRVDLIGKIAPSIQK